MPRRCPDCGHPAHKYTCSMNRVAPIYCQCKGSSMHQKPSGNIIFPSVGGYPQSIYTRDIMAVTGCRKDEVGGVEEIMRQEIFHSTLDWIDQRQFIWGAKQAYEIYKQSKI